MRMRTLLPQVPGDSKMTSSSLVLYVLMPPICSGLVPRSMASKSMACRNGTCVGRLLSQGWQDEQRICDRGIALAWHRLEPSIQLPVLVRGL